MKGLNTSTLIRLERLQGNDNPYYDTLLIVKEEEEYHVKYYHTETGLVSTGTTYYTLNLAYSAFETIFNLGK